MNGSKFRAWNLEAGRGVSPLGGEGLGRTRSEGRTFEGCWGRREEGRLATA